MLQQKIFEKVLSSHENQAEALDKISELLFLSKSNVYRRLSGDIALKVEEIETLAKHYKFSVDLLIYEESEFYPMRILEAGKPETNYDEEILKIAYQRTLHPDSTSHYMSSDLIYTFYTEYPEIHYFKIIQWQRLMWVDENKKYSLDDITEEMRYFLKKYQSYVEQTKVVLFLEKNTGTLFLEQLRYTYNMGVMSEGDIRKIIEAYKRYIDDLEKRAALGQYVLNGRQNNLEVYITHSPIQSLIVLNSSEAFSYAISLFIPPVDTFSSEPRIMKKLNLFFEQLKNKSTKITNTGVVARRKLFNHYRNQVKRFERQLFEDLI